MLKKNIDPPLLLDTHIWIWLFNGDRGRISSHLDSRIERAALNASLFVSAISIWEAAMLEAKGRLSFSLPCIDWVRSALASPGMQLAPLDPGIAVESTRLPGSFHGDPADRIIVATARSLGAAIVTADKRIISYAGEGYCRIVT